MRALLVSVSLSLLLIKNKEKQINNLAIDHLCLKKLVYFLLANDNHIMLKHI